MHVGTIVGEKYEILRELSQGGMGKVWVARHVELERQVAVKVLHSRGLRPDRIALFRQEARSAARVSNPHVVAVHDFGLDGGRPYLVMELLRGEDLRRWLLRSGPLRLDETLWVAEQVATGLEAAHAEGLVHCDLKPENVFVASAGKERVVKVLDFGIVRRADRDLEESGLGQDDSDRKILGTPAYMSPEQVRAEPLDARTDIWGLGVLLYELITGTNPFLSDDLLNTLARVAYDPIPPPSTFIASLDGPVDDCIMRALRRPITARYASATALVEAFRAALSGVTLAPASVPFMANPGGTVGRASETLGVADTADAPPPSIQTGPVAVLEERLECHLVVPEPLSDDGAQIWSRVDGKARLLGGAVDRLFDGSWLIGFQLEAPDNTVRDQAHRAATMAIWLQSRVAIERSAILIERRSSASGVLEVASRARRLIQGGRAGIRVDSAAVRLLADSYVMHTAPDGTGLLVGVAPGTGETRGQFVGRREELRALADATSRVVRERRPHLLALTGAPGIGKSRLVESTLWVEAVAEAQSSEVDVWYGRADQADGSPFALIVDLIQRRLGLPRPSDFHRRLLEYATMYVEQPERVAAFLGEIALRPEADAHEQIVYARQLPQLMAQQIIRAWTDLLFAHAERKPVVLIADQLEAADRGSFSALSALLTRADCPLLLIGAGRGDDAIGRIQATAGQRTMLHLGPLGESSARDIAAAAIGERAVTERVDQIVELGQGNPRLIEELAANAQPHGLLTSSPSIQALVEARLLALPADARRILRTGSVFGMVFPFEGVQELLRISSETLAEQMSLLAGRDVVDPVVDPRGGPAAHWTFRHALFRDAAYQMTSAEDRQNAHLAAGYYLEGLGHAPPSIIAHHFDRGERPRRAVRHYARAARLALLAADVAEARKLAERSLELALPSEQAPLFIVVAETHLRHGEWKLQLERAVQAMREAPRGSSDWLTAASLAASAAAGLGEHRISINVANELLEMPVPAGDTPEAEGFVTACARIGLTLHHKSGERALGDALLARAELDPSPTEEGQPIAFAALCRARAYSAEDTDLRASLEWLQACARAYLRMGDRQTAGFATQAVAHIQYKWGMYRASYEGNKQAIELIGETSPTILALLKQNLGGAAARLGLAAEAIELLQSSLSVLDQAEDLTDAGGTRTYLAPLLAESDPDAAFHQAQLAVQQTQLRPPLCAYALGVQAMLELDHGSAERATQAAERAMELLLEMGSLSEGEALVRLAHARCLERAGDRSGVAREIKALYHVLRNRAVRLRDKELVQAFWDNVAEHREARRMYDLYC